MSVDIGKSGHSTRRRSKLDRARRNYLLVAAIAISLTVVVATWWLEPRYKATARLELDGRTFPVEAGENTRSQVDEFLQTMHDMAASGLRQPSESGFELLDVSSAVGGSEDLRSVAATFEIYAETADAGTSGRAVEGLAGAYAEVLRDMVPTPPVSAAELENARRELAAAQTERERVELMLTAFERDNAAVLPGLEEVREQALAEFRRERGAVEEQLRTLEARRNELDANLAEVQRGASQFDGSGATPLTSAAFAAAQARWTVLRTLHGDDHVPASELGAALSEAKAAADARLASVSAELDVAREGYRRSQASLPLDHPDVIGFAHRVSALERLYEQTRVTGLSDRDLRSIAGLARERRDIDVEIDRAREQRAVLEARQGEQIKLAEQAPLVAEQHLLLQAQVADVLRRYENAEARYAALQEEVQAASYEQPGELLVANAVEVTRLTMSSPVIAAALICLLCFPIFLITLRLIERRHRTISGSNAIMQIQGRPPLAVIPELGGG